MKKSLLSVVLLFVISNSFASKIDSLNFRNAIHSSFDSKKDKKKHKNRRAERPIGINLIGFGPGGLISASVDAFISPKFAIEAGAGLRTEEGDVSYFLGGRYHLLGGTFLNTTPYLGLYTAFHNEERNIQNHSIYVPVGIHRIKKTGFNWSAEIAYEKNTFKESNLSGAFKIGYRF